MLNIKNLILILSISCIASCSTNKNIENSTIKPEEQVTVKPKSPPNAFQISGAIAVNKQKHGFSAAIKWNQTSTNQYYIKISSLLSGKTVIVTKENGVIKYQEGSKIVKADNAEKLLSQEAKIHLPVTNLYYWVRAIPAPYTKNITNYNSFGQLTSLEQQGFVIQYGEYFNSNNGYFLPKKIKLTGHGIIIKLAIRNWDIL